MALGVFQVGGGVLSGFQFYSPKKMSFQTYTLPSPHPLSDPWPCKHKNNAITRLQIILRGCPPLSQS